MGVQKAYRGLRLLGRARRDLDFLQLKNMTQHPEEGRSLLTAFSTGLRAFHSQAPGELGSPQRTRRVSI